MEEYDPTPLDPTSTGTARHGAVELYYETWGDPVDPTLLLVNGLGSQLINWEPEFCRLLVEAGFRVVTFRQPRRRVVGQDIGPTARRHRHGRLVPER